MPGLGGEATPTGEQGNNDPNLFDADYPSDHPPIPWDGERKTFAAPVGPAPQWLQDKVAARKEASVVEDTPGTIERGPIPGLDPN